MYINKLISEFKRIFQTDEEPQLYFAPGRVNIIGEHIDYNGGNVLPFAIDLGTYAAVCKRNDNIINFASTNFPETSSIKISDIIYNNVHAWANYPKGVISVLNDAGFKIDKGFDILFSGDLPNQAGLSSSASIELAMATVLNDLFDFRIDMLDLVKYCQLAENSYMQLNCGIMDQFAIGMSKKNQAILLNTDTNSFEFIPLNIDEYIFIVSNTKKHRTLVDSKYNDRLGECREALSIFQKKITIDNLCQLSIEKFEKNKHLLTDGTIRKRALHVVTEQIRTIEAAKALKNNDFEKLGKLLNESHYSLRDNYEVTGFELDSLQEAALSVDGVLGSRMTGAGFGGCTISLVNKKVIDKFKTQVYEIYLNKTGLKPEFYIVKSGDGAGKIS